MVTLGIIGVVAAMTVPTLMHKIRSKVFAVQFKKTVADVTQAIGRIKAENDIDQLASYCSIYIEDNDTYPNAQNCYTLFNNAYTSKASNTYNGSSAKQPYDFIRSGTEIKTYNGKQFVTESSLAGIGYPIFRVKRMLDGSYTNIWIIEGQLYFGIDFNGDGKPNRLGHDIFIFVINKKDDFVSYSSVPKEVKEEDIPTDSLEYQKERYGYPCNFNSTQKGNGIGCVYYALKNKCPDGSAKNYFDCLPK